MCSYVLLACVPRQFIGLSNGNLKQKNLCQFSAQQNLISCKRKYFCTNFTSKRRKILTMKLYKKKTKNANKHSY